MKVTCAMSHANAMAIGDNLRAITGIIGELQNYNWDQVVKLFNLFCELRDADNLEEKVIAGLKILEQAALMTNTKVDDQFVLILKQVANENTLPIIVNLVSSLLHGNENDFYPTAIRENRIDWANLLQIAIQLLPLIEKTFR